MLKVVYTKKYEKSLKKYSELQKFSISKIENVIIQLQNQVPLEAKFQDHQIPTCLTCGNFVFSISAPSLHIHLSLYLLSLYLLPLQRRGLESLLHFRAQRAYHLRLQYYHGWMGELPLS